MKVAAPGITELDTIIETISQEEKKLFHRLFHYSIITGHLRTPETETADVGSMELFTSSIISRDTLEVARLLKESLN